MLQRIGIPSMKFAFGLLKLSVALACLWLALDWRSPSMAGVRFWGLAGLVAVPLVLAVHELWLVRAWRMRTRLATAASALTLIAALSAAGVTAGLEGKFLWTRSRVLAADSAQLERLGQHLLVGYRDGAELRMLVERRAIAGIFISARNVQGKSATQIKEEIAALQAIRARQGLPRLWIATDQEGGTVSRLSPPLTRMPPLAYLANEHRDRGARASAVERAGAAQGRELAALGVNLNFAPVIDLNHDVINPKDQHTRIHERAISSDPRVVLEVADHYCSALQTAGVRCTLKHFPGLGRVFEDTHFGPALLAAPPSELAATDWVPFRGLSQHPNAVMMLGHARLATIDRERPASFSPGVVTDLLRRDWKYDGILVTDDFTMGAVYYWREGVGEAGVRALNAGVDLILASFDPDQYYVVMHALLRAYHQGKIDDQILERSERRLGAAAFELPAP